MHHKKLIMSYDESLICRSEDERDIHWYICHRAAQQTHWMIAHPRGDDSSHMIYTYTDACVSAHNRLIIPERFLLTGAVVGEACSPGRVGFVLIQFIRGGDEHGEQQKSGPWRHLSLNDTGAFMKGNKRGFPLCLARCAVCLLGDFVEEMRVMWAVSWRLCLSGWSLQQFLPPAACMTGAQVALYMCPSITSSPLSPITSQHAL